MTSPWPQFVIQRSGRFFQQRAVVRGFHWETSGVAWVRNVARATKFPRTIAEQIAREHGGVAVSLDAASRRVR
jgi:hypothetical protein